MRYICVFCGSSLGHHQGFTSMAQRLGHALVQQEMGLVYGGGNIGLMGVLASTVLQEGGTVIGVIPKHLAEKELLHQDLTTTHIVNTMHERKTLMADLSAGFITLPGGFGTLEECCEMVTWAQLELHHKPCGLLNCFGFFDGLLSFFDHQVQQGFLIQANRALLLEATTPEDLLTLVLGRLEPDVR
ncbi:MAG: TIGR00730 family Rossman fold protein [Nitrospirota bacterium]|nr:TIGR00730 family Rossman fold protein [Nitrospirota bacterium]MDH5698722.1 TIGR00730 family Rossman fold protein [Nitrospirota bacterium]